MNAVPMFDVIPVTGPNRGQGRVCYVCKLGSAPVIAVFIRQKSLEEAGLLEAVQKVADNNATLQAFVVCLGEPSQELEDRLRTLAAKYNLRIPLTVLPEGKLPSGLTRPDADYRVDPDAKITVLFYRGRQIVKKFDDESFFSTFRAKSARRSALGGPGYASETLKELSQAASEMIDRK